MNLRSFTNSRVVRLINIQLSLCDLKLVVLVVVVVVVVVAAAVVVVAVVVAAAAVLVVVVAAAAVLEVLVHVPHYIANGNAVQTQVSSLVAKGSVIQDL